ncbi:MAG TPA: hypothetical protein ENN46_03755 [Candidatus Woesearchaeota archaeon]|mgnify:CR=1 FL=1|nr:hypothetical protein [Candidatus Woesearchaeota archaeon]
MKYELGRALSTLRESLEFRFSPVSLKDKPAKVRFSGYGLNRVPGLMLSRLIESPVSGTNEPEKGKLIVLFADEGNDDEQDLYRSFVRSGSKILVFSRNTKFEELCRINESLFIKMPELKYPELNFFSQFLIASRAFFDLGLVSAFPSESLSSFVSKMDFSSSVNSFHEKMWQKNITLLSSEEAYPLAEAWRIFITRYAGVAVSLDRIIDSLYFRLNSLSTVSFILFFISDSDSSVLKRRLKVIREVLPFNSTQMVLKGEFAIYKVLLSSLLGFFLSIELSEKDDPLEYSKVLKDYLSRRFV